MQTKNNAGYLLALHSSTKNFGVAVTDLADSKKVVKSLVVNTGQKLSNHLFKYVGTLLPLKEWQDITRIAVATGPGSFTGTRITLAMARTMAQQLNCQIDGFSSFALMAPRLSKSLKPHELKKSFWITQKLDRRGIIAGEYKILEKSENKGIETVEIQKPHLLKKGKEVKPALNVVEDVNQDIKVLIENCLNSHMENKKSSLELILPIYPTSPVESKE